MLKLLTEEETKQEKIKPIPAESAEENELEIDSDIMQSACENSINLSIQSAWDFISEINGIIATFEQDYKKDNLDSIKDILNKIVDETTINIGMLHKVNELVSEKTNELLQNGKEKAEEIISSEDSDSEK